MEKTDLEIRIDNAKDMIKSLAIGKARYKNINILNKKYQNNYVTNSWLATTENLNYYYDLTSFEGKDVLATTSSGDHAFNALLLGAKSVETFDINSVAQYISNLKEAAIKNLTREEFIKFISFNLSERNILPKNVYESFSHLLDDETQQFFDSIYDYAENIESKYYCFYKPITHLVHHSFTSKSLMDSNPYLKNNENYYKLQSRLKNMKTPITHKVCIADRLEENFQQKDIILLSNVMDTYWFMKSKYSKESLKRMLTSIPKLLNPGGTACIHYHFNNWPSEIPKDRTDLLKSYYPNLQLLQIPTIINQLDGYEIEDIVYKITKENCEVEK